MRSRDLTTMMLLVFGLVACSGGSNGPGPGNLDDDDKDDDQKPGDYAILIDNVPLEVTLTAGVANVEMAWRIESGDAAGYWNLLRDGEVVHEAAVAAGLPQSDSVTVTVSDSGIADFALRICASNEVDAECSDDILFPIVVRTQPGSDCVNKNLAEGFGFASVIDAAAGETVSSHCILVEGLDAAAQLSTEKAELSVNGGEFQAYTGGDSVTVTNGDELQLRTTSSTTPDQPRWTYLLVDGNYRGVWRVTTRNSDERAPQEFHVGPGRDYRQLHEVADLIRAGDTVFVDGGASYEPVQFNRAGQAAMPVRIIGVPDENGARPLIAGGDTTVEFAGAHYYRFENFEITGGEQVCIRNNASHIRLTNIHMHDCLRHGVLGSDTFTGSVFIDRMEAHHAGGEKLGGNLKHPIYVATDPHAFPGSTLRVTSSYLHDFGGNGIKSRAEKIEAYYNWIEPGDYIDRDGDSDVSYYAIEANGFDGYTSGKTLNVDIVGNAFIARDQYLLRVGGDGTGSLYGHVRIAQNTMIMDESFTRYTTPIRFFGVLRSVYAANNLFYHLDNTPIRVQRLESEVDWVEEYRYAGTHNWVPEGSDDIAEYFPSDWVNTVFGTENPGHVNVDGFDSLDLSLTAESSLRGAGGFDTHGPAEYRFSGTLDTPLYTPPSQRPETGSWLPRPRRKTSSPPNIGAY